jgi:hypothetical protein
MSKAASSLDQSWSSPGPHSYRQDAQRHSLFPDRSSLGLISCRVQGNGGSSSAVGSAPVGSTRSHRLSLALQSMSARARMMIGRAFSQSAQFPFVNIHYHLVFSAVIGRIAEDSLSFIGHIAQFADLVAVLEAPGRGALQAEQQGSTSSSSRSAPLWSPPNKKALDASERRKWVAGGLSGSA